MTIHPVQEIQRERKEIQRETKNEEKRHRKGGENPFSEREHELE